MYYIQQLQNNDCGMACLKMLLARIFKDKNYLYIRQDLNHGSYSYQDIIDNAKEYGLILNGYRYSNKKMLRKDHIKNALATIKIDGGGTHMVLVKNIHFSIVKISDPYLGNYSMSFKKFLLIWDGTLLRIDDIRKRNVSLINPYHLSALRKLTLIIIRILGLISGILGIFYIDNAVNWIVPISLIFACFCLEIIYRITTINAMKKIDADILNSRIKPDNDPNLFIQTFSSFKQYEVMLFPTLIFSFTISLFIVVIFVLNDVRNFIPILLTILLTFVDTFIFSSVLETKKKAIERKEEAVRAGHTGSRFIEEFKSLIKKSYEFGNFYMIKKMALIIFIISMVVSFMFICQIKDFSFIVFYCFGYYYLHSNLKSLLTFSSKKDFLEQQRCLLMNIIKK